MCHTCMYGISINLWGLNTDVFIKTNKQTNKQIKKQKNDLGLVNQTTSQLILPNISKIYESCILYLLSNSL